MSKRSLLLLALLWVALAAIAGYEALALREQRARIAQMKSQAAQRGQESAALRRNHAALSAELATAEKQLAALTPDTEAARLASDVRDWFGRVKELRRLFDERPDQHIPELRFLTDDDWLRAARHADLSSEKGVRKALADLRNLAVTLIARSFNQATHGYRSASSNTTPSDVAAFVPHIANSAHTDPAILARYEVVSHPAGSRPDTWSIRLRTAVDPIYDHRPEILPGGEMRVSRGVFGWTPGFAENYDRAAEAYNQAHRSLSPPNILATIPYFHPPLASDVVAALLAEEREEELSRKR